MSEKSIPLSIDAGTSIAEKVQKLQSFLGEHYFRPDGIMYCMWFYDGKNARLFKEDDLGELRFPFCAVEGISHEDWMSGENSSSTSGLFLWSQALRYQVTGEAEAMRYAEKAFNSLDIIFKLSEAKGIEGFVCKPWGGRASTGTSPDQYICVMNGMWEYRKIASHAHRKRIDSLLPKMADWWRTRDYTIVFGGVKWPILPHHCPAMACLHSMAYRVSGEFKYLDECERLLAQAGAWPTWIERNRRELTHDTGFPIEKNGVRWPKQYEGLEYDPARRKYLLFQFENGEIWLTMACADFFMREEPRMAPIIRQAIGRHLKYLQFGMRSDHLTVMTLQTDLERDAWHPVPWPKARYESSEVKDEYADVLGGEVCWGDFASRIIDGAVIGLQHAPEFCPGAFRLAKTMASRLDNQRLHWIIDPDGKQVKPMHKGILNLLSSDAPSFATLGYWRARRAGIDLDAAL
jgi:hypothetical protein